MQDLLATLSALEVKLEVRAGGKLHVNAPAGVLTPELHQQIGRHKEALIERLLASRTALAQDELPAITPDPERRHQPFPLNDVQHAYWFGRNSQIEFGSVSTHVYFEFECGALDLERLGGAFNRVIAHHDMMRAVIDVNGEQRVLESVPDYEIAAYDLRSEEPDARQAVLDGLRAELSHQVLPCDAWPLFDIRLARLEDHHSRLFVSWDFLMVDAWSMLLIFQQWHAFYGDPGFVLEPLQLRFRDYVLAEVELKEAPLFDKAHRYWWQRIDDLPKAPALPLDHKIERGRPHEFTRRRHTVPKERWEKIKTRARSEGITPSSVLLAAFAEVLQRWSRSPHYCLNLTLFNRLPMHEEVGSIVGDFTNLMLLEVDGREGDTFLARAARIQERFLEDFEHRQVSAVEVMRELAGRRGWQQQALYPVVFTSTLMLEGRGNEERGGLERFGPMGYGISQTPQVWLDYQIFEEGGDLVFNWDAVEEAFLPGVLDEMFEAHHRLLGSLAGAPEGAEDVWHQEELVDLPAAQLALRAAVNDTAAERVEVCLHTPFVERALEDPRRTALLGSHGTMSYGELLAQSQRLAEWLIEKEAATNLLVAVVMDKGWEQFAAVLAIEIAGAAYLPIDPGWPALRRAHLLEQGEVRLVLTQPALVEALEWPADVELLAVARQEGLDFLRQAPALRQSPEDLAYVIFTSGSTGTPKGVVIDHRGAMNTVAHINRLFDVGRDDRVLAVSSLTFDLSVYDVFGPLAIGAAVVIPNAGLARDPGHWQTLITEHGVTLWNSAPPLMGVLVDALESRPAGDLSPLRLVLLSGDWIPVGLPDRIKALAPEAHVVSLGGATEGSIWSIYHEIERVDPSWDSIPYGKALPNQRMYVLDSKLRPCPDLVTGDIYIGGLGVALGYWKSPEKTRRQFLEHPESGERLYATGDLGRLRRDGNIEFLGREDSQVKVRGYRVELGEISAAIQGHPEVREAVVQLVELGGRSSLVAYLVADRRAGGELFVRVEADAADLERVSALVEEAGRAAEHGEMVPDLVRALVGGWASDKSLRILEVGAGAGDTSAAVLPVLPVARTEYWYTDPSAEHVEAAKETFRHHAFVRYGTLDLDRAPAGAGPQLHSYDLILAADVVADHPQSLDHLRDLLRPGGHLLIVERAPGEASGDQAEAGSLPFLLPAHGFEEVYTSTESAEDDSAAIRVIMARSPAAVASFKPEGLIDYLAQRLPEYMVPQRYVPLERFPLTANGKVDVAALPREISAQGAEEQRIVFPKSDTEERILEIWREVLGVEQLSTTSNFFEVGGNSLLMTEVLRMLNRTQEPPLTVAELFSYPTIQSLAAYLSSGEGGREAVPEWMQRSRVAGAEGADADADGDVAIIGMAGRFPDAESVDQLWRNLAAGKCAVQEFSEQELLAAGVSEEELAQENYVRAAPVLAGKDLFDAAFFGIPPREAEIMDPQQRFLLECAVEALGNAGYATETQGGGRIGVFVGKGPSLYLLEHLVHHPEIFHQMGLTSVLMVNDKDHAATMVSYKLNLTGPSVNVNTTCSTSLVAIHSACQSLENGDCEIALAGGVSFVRTLERAGYVYQVGDIVSPDGYCRAFSDDANGSVFGSGVGLVVLKPLAAALRDRDTVHAVIKGSAINNDGSLKAGYSALNVHGPADVVARALARANVSPDSIQFMEAFGAGTPLGDSIEFSALRKVFGGPRADGSRCALGSIKTNLGNLDAASGVAGLIKAVEALKHREIPSTLHVSAPNRRIDFEDSPFYLNSETVAWPAGATPRRAGVSSFGVGGTNVHIVLEEAPAAAGAGSRDDGTRDDGGAQLLLLSARSRRSLERMREELAEELARRDDLALEDVAFTLQVGRATHEYRDFVVCDTRSAARRALAERPEPSRHDGGQNTEVVFLFPGEGVPQRDACVALYATESAFESALHECAEIVARYTGEDFELWLHGEGADGDDRGEASCQCLLFSLEYALARFWQSLGVRPAAMLGHGLGEYVAACLAGVFSLEEVLSLLAVREQLLESLEAGATPALHTPRVDPLLATYEKCVAEVLSNPPRIPFISGVSGGWITDEQATSPAYWARQMRQPLRFAEGLEELRRRSHGVLLEVGWGRQALATAGVTEGRVVSTFSGAVEEPRADLLECVGRLWSQGVEVRWGAVSPQRPRRRVPLPTYVFDRKRYFIPRPGRIGAVATPGAAQAAALGSASAGGSHATSARDLVHTEYVAPSDEIQTRLIDIWRDFLGIENIGIVDNFFELGGDSLLAARVFAQIQKEYEVEPPVDMMFELGTVRAFSLFIRASTDPDAIETFSEEELDEFLAVMEA